MEEVRMPVLSLPTDFVAVSCILCLRVCCAAKENERLEEMRQKVELDNLAQKS